MKNKLITDYTDEELIKNEKTLKVMTIMLMCTLVLLFCALLFLTIEKGFSPLLIAPVCLFPLLLINFINWNNLKKEKARRNLK
ncbi:redox-active disulfide protein 2 [Chryseobacterium soli]|uniref:redox-active disulfide protein 2 n=1 Tax=Chryseobacterium soli TaxID=445961 RepID=UPI0029537593|nr:redox-active disulfide protein 2 [Chryseobacterium soli]MDV7697191.1 redox-active disulfide protein 2 [Chryseobacterium soli]